MHSDTQHEDPASNDWPDILGPLSELPSSSKRSDGATQGDRRRGRARRLDADRGGVPRLQHLGRGVLGGERDLDRNGVPGL